MARAKKSKRQKRRCLSIRGLDHQRAMAYCAQEDRSLSGLVEELLAAHLDKAGQPKETLLRARVWGPGKTGPKPGGRETASGIFTF